MEFSESPASVIILIVTVGLSLMAMSGKSSLMGKMILHPYSVVHRRKYYLLFTSSLIHADIMHMLFNMLTFYFFALKLEYTIGTADFIIIYIAGMILSDISTVIKQKNNPDYYALGSSGAVSAILFSFILFYPNSKIGVLLLPIGIPAFIFAILYLAYCYYASKRSNDLINHEAHLWGAISGLIITILLIPESISIFINTILGKQF